MAVQGSRAVKERLHLVRCHGDVTARLTLEMDYNDNYRVVYTRCNIVRRHNDAPTEINGSCTHFIVPAGITPQIL